MIFVQVPYMRWFCESKDENKFVQDIFHLVVFFFVFLGSHKMNEKKRMTIHVKHLDKEAFFSRCVTKTKKMNERKKERQSTSVE
jgi:amino acid permease